jgi:hypothetical protein
MPNAALIGYAENADSFLSLLGYVERNDGITMYK